jgi:hypothetical protein
VTGEDDIADTTTGDTSATRFSRLVLSSSSPVSMPRNDFNFFKNVFMEFFDNFGASPVLMPPAKSTVFL